MLKCCSQLDITLYKKIFCDKLTAVRTISITFTCKISTDSAKICHNIIIFHWIQYCDTLLESQESPLYNGMPQIKMC